MSYTVEDLWKELGNISIDEGEHIDTQFLHFPPGTIREDIWHWFEETFDVSVATLMELDL